MYGPPFHCVLLSQSYCWPFIGYFFSSHFLECGMYQVTAPPTVAAWLSSLGDPEDFPPSRKK